MPEEPFESTRRKSLGPITAQEEEESYEARQRQIASHREAAIAARRAVTAEAEKEGRRTDT